MTATLTLALNLMAAPEFVRVRLHAGQKPFSLQGQVVCGAQTVKNPKVRSAGSLWLVGSAKLTKTANCAGKGRFQFGDVRWRGEARLNRRGKTLQLVAVLDMESYVAGVVNAEVLPGWPPASLKAMAVAARTYTHWRRASRRQADWDVTADVSSQVYRGGMLGARCFEQFRQREDRFFSSEGSRQRPIITLVPQAGPSLLRRSGGEIIPICKA